MLGASGGSGFFFLIIIIFAFLWLVLIRPQKKRQQAAARMLNTLNVGDEVLTAGGIYGEITGVEDDAVKVQIAPGLEVRVARKAIGAVVPKDVEPEETEAPDEPETGSTEPPAP